MRKINKSSWGHGPWSNEPDQVYFEYRGLKCGVLRHPDLGNFCGYVQVPESHPLYGKNSNMQLKITSELIAWGEKQGKPFKPGLGHFLDVLSGKMSLGSLFAVHGGVTYTGVGIHGFEGWVMGFDCGHCDDLQPGMVAHMKLIDPSSLTYRDLAYVRSEVEYLADQILRFDINPTEDTSEGSGEEETVIPEPVEPEKTSEVKAEKKEVIIDQPKKFQKAEDDFRVVCDVSQMYH